MDNIELQELISNNEDLFYEYISKPRLWLVDTEVGLHSSYYLVYYKGNMYDYSIENLKNTDPYKPIFHVNFEPIEIDEFMEEILYYNNNNNDSCLKPHNFINNFKKYIILKKLAQ